MSGLAVRVTRSEAETSLARAQVLLAEIEDHGGDRSVASVIGPIEFAHAAFFTTPESVSEEFPVTHPTRDMWVLADARLDYRDELLEKLHSAGCSFEPVTDADFILAAHEVWGDDAQTHLEGDFAYVVWDQGKILAARDVIGTRPLWWARAGDEVVVASTIRCVLGQLPSVPEPNEVFIADLLSTRLARNDYTAYQDVFRLEPGSRLIVRPGQSEQLEQIDQLRVGPLLDITTEDAEEQVHAALLRAVAERMRTIEPVACELSGGLDSSTIVGLAASLTNRQIVAISNVMPGEDCDESEYIAAVVEHFGLQLFTSKPLDHDPIDLRQASGRTKNIVACPDQNIELWSLAPRANHRTVLTGHGGDEAFGDPAGSRLDHLLGLAPSDRARYLLAASNEHRKELLRQLARGLLTGPTLLNIGVGRLLHARRVRNMSWLSSRLSARVSLLRSNASSPGLKPEWNRTARLDSYGSPDRVLNSEHLHQTSAGLVDLRHPFYDRRFIELILRIPTEALYPGGTSRAFHRQAFAESAPQEVLARTDKAEFSIYYRRSVAHNAGAGFGSLSVHTQGWTNREELSEWAEHFTSGKTPGHLFPLWYCLTVSCWLDATYGTGNPAF